MRNVRSDGYAGAVVASAAAVFRCPWCSGSLGNDWRCLRCNREVALTDGVLDFVVSEGVASERAFYEAEYSEITLPGVSLEAISEWWDDPRQAQHRVILERMPDLQGASILLVGNGTAMRELLFVASKPQLLVHSDLSPKAVRAVRENTQELPEIDRVLFVALDAMNLPFKDRSLDLVYGYAMAHHLPDAASFVHEVARVLKPGGSAIFFDDAYAPIWQRAKLTLLRPLMRYAHRREPVSPEDLRASRTGGFRETELAALVGDTGSVFWSERTALLHYLWVRGTEKLLPERVRGPLNARVVLRALLAIDNRLAGLIPAYRRNLIRLVWGFKTPH